MRISDWSSDVCSSDLANQAFGRRRAAFGSDIAVPAAKFPLKRDKPLANGERLPFVFLSHCDLQEAASEFIRGSHMIGQGGATGGQGRINFLRGGSDPIALSFWPDCSFQIVAQSSGKRVFVSRRGLDPVKRAMMTGPVIDGLAKSGRFAVERGEGRLCRRKSGFGGTPRFRGDGARGFCQRYGGFCLFAVSARFLLRGQGGIALCLHWGRFGQAVKLLLQALTIALAAIAATFSRVQGGFRPP